MSDKAKSINVSLEDLTKVNERAGQQEKENKAMRDLLWQAKEELLILNGSAKLIDELEAVLR